MPRNPWASVATAKIIELWDISGKMKSKDGPAHHTSDDDGIKLYHSLRTITCQAPPTALSVCGNGVLVVGEEDGRVELFDASRSGKGKGKGEESASSSSGATQECLQMFSDHKGAITDMHVVSTQWNP